MPAVAFLYPFGIVLVAEMLHLESERWLFAQRLEAVTARMNGAVLLVGPLGEVLVANEPAVRGLGVDVGQPLQGLSRVEPGIREALLELWTQLGAGIQTPRREVVLAGGQRWLCTARQTPLGRKEQGAVLALVDRTRDHLEAQQAAQARSVASIGRLTGGIAHDYNNVLGAIQGEVGLLQLRAGKKGEVPRELEEMAVNVREAAALAQDILAFSRGGRGAVPDGITWTKRPLQRLVPRLDQILGETASLRLEDTFTEAEVPLSESQWTQTVLTLVLCASEFVGPEGHVIVRRTLNLNANPSLQLLVVVPNSGLSGTIRDHALEPLLEADASSAEGISRLSEVTALARAAGGGLTTGEEGMGGLTLRLTLPLAR